MRWAVIPVLVALATCSCSGTKNKAEDTLAGKWVDTESAGESLHFGQGHFRYENSSDSSAKVLLHDYTLAADGKEIDLIFSPTGIMGSESDFGVTLSPDLTRTWVWVAGPTKEREQIKIVYPPWVKGVPVQVIKSGGMMDFHANLALTGDEMSLTVTEGKSMSKEPFKFDRKTFKYRKTP